MTFKKYIQEVQTHAPDDEEEDCTDKICRAGSSKCFCRRKKAPPKKLDVTFTLASGAVGAMKGAG